MDFAEYRRHDATGLARLVAEKQVSAAELLQVARERAAEVNPRINAIVRDVPCAGDEERSGPFAGVPFLIKDLGQDYAGLPTSSGSRSLQSVPAAEHSTVVQRWLDAGLAIFGKTNLPEFGAKAISEPDAWGPARNPWDLTRTPGGSSGGSAAAVAAGIVPAAGANDGGGSTRIPAACCGLVGLKPGRGLTPLGPGAGEMMHGAAVQGVVTRTVRDSAALLDVMAGGEPWGPYQPSLPSAPYSSVLGKDPGRLRIGVRVPSAITPDPHPEAYAAVAGAVRALTDLGHEVEELAEAPFDDAALAREFLLAWFVYIAWEVRDAQQRPRHGLRARHPDHGGARQRHERGRLPRRGGAAPPARAAALDVLRHLRPAAHPDPGHSPAEGRGVRAAGGAAGRGGRAAAHGYGAPAHPHADRRRHGAEEPGVGALHPARQRHGPPGDLAAAAPDGGRAPARRAARGPARGRDLAPPAGRPARGVGAVGRPGRAPVRWWSPVGGRLDP
ncbi:amidase [Nocardioides sp. ChNu-99]|nr:amidase [Nocardioides sp. ChNu-99]